MSEKKIRSRGLHVPTLDINNKCTTSNGKFVTSLNKVFVSKYFLVIFVLLLSVGHLSA